jgi:hypothetical protein
MNSYHEEYFLPRFARDVVPTQPHFNWEFVVESNFEEPTVSLTWDNTALGTNSAQLLLYDVEANMVIDMKRNGLYQFDVASKRKLKIFYGTDEKSLAPDITGLGRPYPNPSSSSVSIPFVTGTSNGDVQIAVYDLMGKRIRVVARDYFEPGFHTVYWDGSDEQGNRVSQGIYIYRLETAGRDSQQGRIAMK